MHTRPSYNWLWILILLFIHSFKSHAHPPGELAQNQWVIAFQAGSAMMLTEVAPDFSSISNEFNHQPGLALDFAVSHTLGSHWEPGFDLSINHLSGTSPLPDFSAIGIHARFINLNQLPVIYQTASTSGYAFIRYYFRAYPKGMSTKMRIDPFFEVGVGVNHFKTKLNYQQTPSGESTSLIFEKGQGRNLIPGSSAQYTMGTGTRINFRKAWNLLLSLDMDVINSDCVDAVHNYDSQGNRIHARAILPRLKIGVIIPITNPLRTTNTYLPWSGVKR
ncbi:MAG TPA: hypothetical protein VKA27_08845 [Sunxiuqinia sp.]|nr:hypothetical protein [Sunxiuqinia sp.]